MNIVSSEICVCQTVIIVENVYRKFLRLVADRLIQKMGKSEN